MSLFNWISKLSINCLLTTMVFIVTGFVAVFVGDLLLSIKLSSVVL